MGDNVLRKFSSILENYFNRNKDIVGRLGGDEFAVFVGEKTEKRKRERGKKKRTKRNKESHNIRRDNWAAMNLPCS